MSASRPANSPVSTLRRRLWICLNNRVTRTPRFSVPSTLQFVFNKHISDTTAVTRLQKGKTILQGARSLSKRIQPTSSYRMNYVSETCNRYHSDIILVSSTYKANRVLIPGWGVRGGWRKIKEINGPMNLIVFFPFFLCYFLPFFFVSLFLCMFIRSRGCSDSQPKASSIQSQPRALFTMHTTWLAREHNVSTSSSNILPTWQNWTTVPEQCLGLHVTLFT